MVQTLIQTKPIMDEAEQRMQKTLDATRQEFHNLHTGRASVTLVEGLKVDYYGTITPLKGLASISTPDSKTLQIQPWDVSGLSAIEKAIQTSGLGLVPHNAGKLYRFQMLRMPYKARAKLI